MTCSSVQKQMALYVAGEVSAIEADRISRHLEGCARCAREAEAMEETHERLEMALRTDREPSIALDDRVLAAIQSAAGGRRPVGLKRRALALTAFACLLVAGVAAWLRYVPRVEVQALDAPAIEAAFRQAGTRGSGPVAGLSKQLSQDTRFPVKVVVPDESHSRLHGGYSTMVGRARVAVLSYAWNNRTAVLLQADARRTTRPDAKPVSFAGETYWLGTRGGMGFVTWRSGRANCVLMARAAPERILPLASAFCEAMEKS